MANSYVNVNKIHFYHFSSCDRSNRYFVVILFISFLLIVFMLQENEIFLNRHLHSFVKNKYN